MNVNITKRALEELNKIMAKKDSIGKAVRLYMAGFGWGGPSIGIALDEQKDSDETVEVDNIKFIVEKDISKSYGNKFDIDYVNDWLRRGFHVTLGGRSSGC